MNKRDFLAMTTAAALAGSSNIIGSARGASGSSFISAKDGTRLCVRDEGEGPSLLFVHSWALTSEMWHYQFADLITQGFRTIAFDRRGHGRSNRSLPGFDMDTLADDLAAVLETADLRDLVLVGHSMGCAEIIRFLARYGSARVAKIVLLAPATPYLTKTVDNPYGAPAAYFDAQRLAMRADFKGWIEGNKAPFFEPDTPTAEVEWLTAVMAGSDVDTVLACNRILAETDLRADLARIDRPALIIQGDRDASAPLDITGRRTAAGIVGAQLKVYPGAPHGLFLTRRALVNADIATFARS